MPDTSKADERSVLDGDPEDAPRGPLSTEPEFLVQIAEAEAGQDFPEGPRGENDPTPLLRVSEWQGRAKDRDAALQSGCAAFEQEFGELPTNYRATIHIIGG